MAFNIKTGDTSPALRVTLTPSPINLVGATVVFNAKGTTSNLSIVRQPVEITDAENGVVTYFWQVGELTTPDPKVTGEFEVTYADGNVETFPNNGYIDINVSKDLG